MKSNIAQQLMSELYIVLKKYEGIVSVASIVGVLELLKTSLMNFNINREIENNKR